MPSSPSGAPGVIEVRPDIARHEGAESATTLDEPYNVLLWNDPVTLMEVVVRVLRRVFGYDAEKAELLMLKAHQEGKVVVWTGERDRAVRYCLELGTNGLQSTVARAA